MNTSIRRFNSIDEVLDFIPENELILTLHLREFVHQCIPDVKEKLSYNVPFYFLNRAICFIWPSSVLWGKRKTYDGVRFGFNKAHLMENPHVFLLQGNRKQVYWRDFLSLEDFLENQTSLKQFLLEAKNIDGSFKPRFAK